MDGIKRQLEELRRGDTKVIESLLREGERRAEAGLLLEVLSASYEANLGEGRRVLLSLHDRLSTSIKDEMVENVIGSGLFAADVCDLLGGGWSYIPPGEFMMGTPNDHPYHREREELHRVKITQGFLMKRTPITQIEWQNLMGNNPSFHQGEGRVDTRNYPVENVCLYDAIAYCNKFSQSRNIETAYQLENVKGIPGVKDFLHGKYGSFEASVCLKGIHASGYRLPTHAEWEYACRGGTSTDFFSDDLYYRETSGWFPFRKKRYKKNLSSLNEIAWFKGNSGEKLHPVAQKSSNCWNLFDMHGLVFEWTGDEYRETARKCVHVDPNDSYEKSSRAVCGGSYLSPAWQCASAVYFSVFDSSIMESLGFRCVRPYLFFSA